MQKCAGLRGESSANHTAQAALAAWPPWSPVLLQRSLPVVASHAKYPPRNAPCDQVGTIGADPRPIDVCVSLRWIVSTPRCLTARLCSSSILRVPRTILYPVCGQIFIITRNHPWKRWRSSRASECQTIQIAWPIKIYGSRVSR